MAWRRWRDRSPVGIDVGGRHINAVQLRSAGGAGDWRIEAAIRLPRSSPGTPLDVGEVERLRDVLFRQAFEPEHVVLAVPGNKLMTGVLDVPPRDSGAPVAEIARMELARAYNVEPDTFEAASWDLPSSDRANRNDSVLAVGCAHRDADALFDVFHTAGLRIAALDTKAWAIAQAVDRLDDATTGIWAALDIEWDAAVLSLFHHHVVLYDRALADAGLGKLYDGLNDTIGADHDVADYMMDEVGLGIQNANLIEAQRRLATHFDSIIKDLDESIVYVARQYPDVAFDRLLLVGDAALIPGLSEPLGRALHAQTCAVKTADLVPCRAALEKLCGDSALIPALGLAMYDERQAA